MTTLSNGIPQISTDLIQEKMPEEKVEMSETPAEETTEKTTEEKTEGKEEGKEGKEGKGEGKEEKKGQNKLRNFFHREKNGEKKKDTNKEENGDAEGGKEVVVGVGVGVGAEEGEVAAEKKKVGMVEGPRKWFQKKMHKEKLEKLETTEDTMTIGINLLDRDERGINDHIKLQFEDVFGEPDGYHSADCAWRTVHRVFTGTRSVVYKVLAFLLSIPCAILWGLFFALFSVFNVWLCVPFARLLAIPATWIAKVWNFVVRSFLDPCFRSCGLICAGINVRHYNEPPTDHIA